MSVGRRSDVLWVRVQLHRYYTYSTFCFLVMFLIGDIKVVMPRPTAASSICATALSPPVSDHCDVSMLVRSYIQLDTSSNLFIQFLLKSQSTLVDEGQQAPEHSLEPWSCLLKPCPDWNRTALLPQSLVLHCNSKASLQIYNGL